MTLRSAVVLGASGSVGEAVVRQLLALTPPCETITLINRRTLAAWEGEARVQQKIVPDMGGAGVGVPEGLAREFQSAAEGCDAAFMTLGVGAPSKVDEATLWHADVILPTEFAKACKAGGVKHVSIMTSVGADATKTKGKSTAAGLGMYVQFKGRVEQNFTEQGFPSLHIFRPSTLLGSPNTPGVMPAVHGAIDWILPAKYKSINVGLLGKGMVNGAASALAGEGVAAGPPKATIFEGAPLQAMCA